MNKFSVAIIDDNDICIKVLRDCLSFYPNIQIKGEAQSSNSGKRVILDQRPDLLFLDMEMPGSSGLELLREVQDQITWPMQIVFYTAYDKYLLEAIHSSAFDYLLKPFKMEDLDQVINRFLDYVRKEQSTITSLHSSIAQLLPSRSAFMIATINGFQILHLEQIGYFTYQKERKQWTVILSNQTHLQLKRNTCASDILKYAPNFVQINQHQIVNIDYMAMIRDNRCILNPPFDRQPELCISRNFFRAMQDKFKLI